MNKILTFFSAIIALFLCLIFMEGVTVYPDYSLEPATIRKVVPDSRGFIGADQMTLIRFEDGFTDEIGGDRGEPGEKVLAYRQIGTKSLFGVFGDKGILFNK